MIARLLPLLLSVLALGGCERELGDLLHRAEVFLRANPIVLYVAGGLAAVALLVKAFRVALALAVFGAILLLLRFLAGF